MRIVLALAGLAQMARHQQAAGSAVHLLLAALLDEDAGYRRFARLGREVLALPAVAAEPRVEKIAQQIGLVPVAGRVARVGDDADAAHRPVIAEQRRNVDRKAVGL